MDIPPNQTLYVKNVSDKMKKEPLKRQLYLAFSAYGRVIDVVVMKGEKLRYVPCLRACVRAYMRLPGAQGGVSVMGGTSSVVVDVLIPPSTKPPPQHTCLRLCLSVQSCRGQAWVVYADVGAATTALRSLQGFPFFGKPLVRGWIEIDRAVLAG
jgi:hypothetical protein